MKRVIIDDFSNAQSWMPVASGQARLKIASERGAHGTALRLDFDFKGGGGFVVARKQISLRLPEVYAFSFRVRGVAPANKFEFKLADPGGANVWRYQQEAFEFTKAGREIVVGHRVLEFAWGPAGGGTLRKTGAIEFVIAAGPGGKGTVWIEDFQWENRTDPRPPLITASSQRLHHEPGNVWNSFSSTGWKPQPSDRKPSITLDFRRSREYGGLILEWERPDPAKAFFVAASDDGIKWKTLHTAKHAEGVRNFIYLPGGESRFLRLALTLGSPGVASGLRHILVQPFDFSRSIPDFFHSIARAETRGSYPRYWLREQSYWTCVGLPDGETCGLINEESLVEVDKGTFSLEPFIYHGGKLITWADVRASQELKDNTLPIPSARWLGKGFDLLTTVFARWEGNRAILWVRYRVRNVSRQRRRGKLFVALRPFQVTPPWQSWKNLGGVSPIHEIDWRGADARINRNKVLIPVTTPKSRGATTFEGAIANYLGNGRIPVGAYIQDDSGFASAAMEFPFDLPVGEYADVFAAVPFGNGKVSPALSRSIKRKKGGAELQAAIGDWENRLGAVRFNLPGKTANAAANSYRTAAGQILINRDGPALQPGARRYTRSWIRDGAIMGAALLRIGERGAIREFVRWYAPFIRADGFVPCAVDRSGPDWLVEHDSHGQFIYAVMEDYRFSGEKSFLREMWPSVKRAAKFMEKLRRQRMSGIYKTDRKECYGLLPESASHEGYLSHPVHSYWDDFWALRGLKDAGAIAGELDLPKDKHHFCELAEEFQTTLRASIRRVITAKRLAYIPGSVEWADFDPTATANAISLLQCLPDLPKGPLYSMFDLYMKDFRKKRKGSMPWGNYTAYEIRIIGALVRMGRREDALELLTFFLGDRRPRDWNQWPEISWRDPRSPGHLGDVPHTWIGAEYMLAFSSLFAYERETDSSLVIGAGVDRSWMKNGIKVRSFPTWYGSLDLTMKLRGTKVEIHIGGALHLPSGGFMIRPPVTGSVKSVNVNGTECSDFSANEVRVKQFPARVVIASE